VNGAGAMDPGVGGPAQQLVAGRQGSPSYGSIDGEETNNTAKDRSNEYSFAPYMAEFVGTCILVFTFGCVALSPAPYLYKPTAAACIVTVMVYSTATVSGGHLNPAVSLTLSALGLIPWQRMLGFWLVQVAAGMAGATALRALLGMDMAHTPWPPAPVPPNLGAAVLAELIYTTLLCFLVSCCLVSKRNNPERDQSQSFGLAIGLLYVAGGHALAPISGGAILNPAIALGLPFISHGSTVMFGIAYVVAELLGAFIGVRLFAILRAGSEDCCCDIEEYIEMCVPRLSARLLGEGLGTFALVFTFGLNVIGQSEATAWSAAAALISMIYALGKISGGYFNPAVTLAVVLSGRSKCSVGDGFAYCGAQAVGAIAAGVTVAEYRFAAPTAWRPVTLPSWQEYGVATVGIAEGVFTLVLAYVVLACSTVTVLPASKTRQNFYFGLAVGFCVMTGGCTLGSVSGGMLNPAVSVGVVTLNLFQEQSAQERHLLLAFCLKLTAFQCTGGLLAAVVFRLTHPSEYSKAPLLMQ